MASLPKWLRSIGTDDEWDADGVLLATIGSVIFLCWMQFSHPDSFDPEKFGQGVAFILGGGGLGYGVKRYGEKSHVVDSDTEVPKS